MPAPEAAKPSLLRAINLRTTFELVHTGGPVAAPHVVRSTGLSKPTVSEVLGQLVDLGLLRRVGRTSGLPGPSAQLYDVNPRAGWVLSLDVGREWVRAALVDLTGAVVGRCAMRTPRSTAKAVISQLRQAAETLDGRGGHRARRHQPGRRRNARACSARARITCRSRRSSPAGRAPR